MKRAGSASSLMHDAISPNATAEIAEFLDGMWDGTTNEELSSASCAAAERIGIVSSAKSTFSDAAATLNLFLPTIVFIQVSRSDVACDVTKRMQIRKGHCAPPSAVDSGSSRKCSSRRCAILRSTLQIIFTTALGIVRYNPDTMEIVVKIALCAATPGRRSFRFFVAVRFEVLDREAAVGGGTSVENKRRPIGKTR